MKALLFIFCILILLSACSNDQKQQDYEQCIAFCSASVDSNAIDPLENEELDFVTIELCREECEEFLT
jgi:uncharacterized protein (UPF0212 family)|tara:strand:- start:37 stop:240 length:204 start_codon:yes stop_codon:yes gene_type:complete